MLTILLRPPGRYAWQPGSSPYDREEAQRRVLLASVERRAAPYVCPRCWIVSHSEADAEALYCAACKGSERDAHVQIELMHIERLSPLGRLVYRILVIRNTWPNDGKTPWGYVMARLKKGPFPHDR